MVLQWTVLRQCCWVTAWCQWDQHEHTEREREVLCHGLKISGLILQIMRFAQQVIHSMQRWSSWVVQRSRHLLWQGRGTHPLLQIYNALQWPLLHYILYFTHCIPHCCFYTQRNLCGKWAPMQEMVKTWTTQQLNMHTLYLCSYLCIVRSYTRCLSLTD